MTPGRGGYLYYTCLQKLKIVDPKDSTQWVMRLVPALFSENANSHLQFRRNDWPADETVGISAIGEGEFIISEVGMDMVALWQRQYGKWKKVAEQKKKILGGTDHDPTQRLAMARFKHPATGQGMTLVWINPRG